MKKKTLVAAGAAASVGAYWMAKKVRAAKRPSRTAPHVVILGAGFGGLTTASKLMRVARGRVRVTIVDRHNYHLFTPLLYQAATCGIVPYDAVFPVRQWTGRHGVQFRQATVTRIDFENKTVHLDSGNISYDFLVIALGSTTNFFGNQSASAHALPLKTMEDGIAIRARIVDTLETATAASDKRHELLTYVVVGGGATGVETAGAIAGLLSELIPADYPSLRREEARIILLESGSKLLGHMTKEMADAALGELRNAAVDVRLNTRATEITGDWVKADNSGDGSSLCFPAHTVIWTTGVRVPDIVAQISTSHSHGGSVVVDQYLRLGGRRDVYAIGDNAHFVDSQTHTPVPLLAATAMQQGETAATNIARAIRGTRQRPFRYRDLGNVVSVGPRAGVARIGNKVIRGFAGWLIWRVVHVARLTSTRNKIAAALDWTVAYFYDADTARLDVEPKSKAA